MYIWISQCSFKGGASVACFNVSFGADGFTQCTYVQIMISSVSGHLLGKSCSFGKQYVLFVKCPLVILVISLFR